jgi:multimeric flavodoxin WrbA
MKVVAFNGSAQKDGNTTILTRYVLADSRRRRHRNRIIQLAGEQIHDCTALRREGDIPTFDAINHFFLISQMIVPGSSHWNVGVGGTKGDVEKDEEGLKTMDDLGKNIAWIIKKTKA